VADAGGDGAAPVRRLTITAPGPKAFGAAPLMSRRCAGARMALLMVPLRRVWSLR